MARTFKLIIAIMVVVLVAGMSLAGHIHPEKWYQEKWCENAGGRVEVVLPDKTR